MPIDLFQEVTDHFACADRALSAPHYNDIMLVGRSRVGGRRSLVSFIAHMQQLTVLSPATSRKYDNKKWKRDFNQVMQMMGHRTAAHPLASELWRCARHLDSR